MRKKIIASYTACNTNTEINFSAHFSKYSIYQTLSWNGAIRKTTNASNENAFPKSFPGTPCSGRGEALFGAAKLMYMKV